MNYRDEDLIKLAFGELDETEAEALKEELAADAAAAAQIGEYNWIKEGLSDLRPVPPMQYSTERLRDAILGEGLNSRKRNPLARILAWTPAGAFGVAAVITGIMLMRTGRESIVAPEAPAETSLTRVAMQMDDLHRPLLAERAFRTLEDQVRASTEFEVGFALTEGTVERQPEATPPKPRAAAKPTRRDSEVGRETRKAVSAPAPAAAPVVESAAIEAADVASEQAPPIVMIGSEDDARTGAPIATEVRFDANVVVGG